MKLGQWMQERGLTKRDLGRLLGCSDTTVGRWATGAIHPNLKMMARILSLTGGEVGIHDFVGEVGHRPVELAQRRGPGSDPVSTAQIEDWLRSKGYKAVSTLLAQTPGIPFSTQVLSRYMRESDLKRWKVRRGGQGKPSKWVGASALDVSDSFRILQSHRGQASPVTLHIEEVNS